MDMEVVTLCGSLKFKKEIMETAVRLESEGKCVLNIIFSLDGDKDNLSEEDLRQHDLAHKKKIDLSDAIYVVNVGGYIGSGTKSEIEYAIQKKKHIYYLENVN